AQKGSATIATKRWIGQSKKLCATDVSFAARTPPRSVSGREDESHGIRSPEGPTPSTQTPSTAAAFGATPRDIKLMSAASTNQTSAGLNSCGCIAPSGVRRMEKWMRLEKDARRAATS